MSFRKPLDALATHLGARIAAADADAQEIHDPAFAALRRRDAAYLRRLAFLCDPLAPIEPDCRYPAIPTERGRA